MDWSGVDYCDVFIILTNHASMESLFIQLSGDVYVSIKTNWPYDCFVVQGHIWFSKAEIITFIYLLEYV